MTGSKDTPILIEDENTAIPVSLAELDRFADKCFGRGLRAGLGYGLALAAIGALIWCLT